MLRRIASFTPKISPKLPYFKYNHFCTSPKPSTDENSQQKSEPKIVITPQKLFIGLVSMSWVYLLYLWYSIQEKTRERAAEYYEQGNTMDMAPPEEYRKEYAEKLIRKIKREKERSKTKISEVTVVTQE